MLQKHPQPDPPPLYSLPHITAQKQTLSRCQDTTHRGLCTFLGEGVCVCARVHRNIHSIHLFSFLSSVYLHKYYHIGKNA